jgi:hypothetical protein
MADRLGVIIKQIEGLPAVRSDADIVRNLQSINKYADSQEQKAYLLGSFLKSSNNFELISSESRKDLNHAIQSQGLQDYFYLHQKPQWEDLSILSIIFILGGVLSLLFGIMHWLRGGIILSSNLRYLFTFVKDGGYQILLGIVFLVGGYIRYRHEQKKHNFLRQLIK